MYKLQIAFENIFFKIKLSFLSFLQASSVWVKQVAQMKRGVIRHTLHGGNRPRPADPIAQRIMQKGEMLLFDKSFSYIGKLGQNLPHKLQNSVW